MSFLNYEQPCRTCGKPGSVSLWSVQAKRYRRFCSTHADGLARRERERIAKRQRRFWRSFAPGAAVDPFLSRREGSR